MNPYPSNYQLGREAAAEARDLADLMALRQLRLIVNDALARTRLIDELRHPDLRWNVADLVETLQGEIHNIDAETQRINRDLVLED